MNAKSEDNPTRGAHRLLVILLLLSLEVIIFLLLTQTTASTRITSPTVITSPSPPSCPQCRQFHSPSGLAIRTIECNTRHFGGRPSNYSQCALDDLSGKYVATSVFREDQPMHGIWDTRFIHYIPLGVVLSERAVQERTLCATMIDGWGEIYEDRPDLACGVDLVPEQHAVNLFERSLDLCRRKLGGSSLYRFKDVASSDEMSRNRTEVCCYSSGRHGSPGNALDAQAHLRVLEGQNPQLVKACPKLFGPSTKHNQYDIQYTENDVTGFALFITPAIFNQQSERDILELDESRFHLLKAYQSILPDKQPPLTVLFYPSTTMDDDITRMKCMCAPEGMSTLDMISLVKAFASNSSGVSVEN